MRVAWEKGSRRWGTPQANLLSIVQVGKLRPRGPWGWAAEVTLSPGSLCGWGSVPPPVVSLFPIYSRRVTKASPDVAVTLCAYGLGTISPILQMSKVRHGARGIIILSRWTVGAQSGVWDGVWEGYREGLSSFTHFIST